MSNSIITQAKILIVDDEESNTLLLSRILESAGYTRIRTVHDSRTVMQMINDWSPDLMLLDIHMPYIDGLRLLNTLRTTENDSEFLPVLVLTADAYRETLKNAFEAGANDYLTKPVDLDEVLVRVRNLLAIRLSHENLKLDNTVLASRLREQMRGGELRDVARADRIRELRQVIETGPTMVFQPIVDLATSRPVGYEALARFDSPTPTYQWFIDAANFGLAADLELSSVRAALAQFHLFNDEQFIAINISPAVLLDPRFAAAVPAECWSRVVVEVTEHHAVEDYDTLRAACRVLQERGARIAIDDAGAGYASLHHILMLAPNIIKIDISLTRDIDQDRVKRALTASILQFARETEAIVVAEGIETITELATLRDIGIPWGQGYYLGRPEPLRVPTTN